MFRLLVALLIAMSTPLTAPVLHAQDSARDSVAVEMGLDRFAAGRNIAVSEPVGILAKAHS